MKCLLKSLLVAFVSASDKTPLNPAFTKIQKGDLGTSLNFGLQTVDCTSIVHDCHKCAISNCEWRSETKDCATGSFSNGATGEMLISNFFKNAAKCTDDLGVCSSTEIKDDLPHNSTANFTLGFTPEKSTDPKILDIIIPEYYFCYQNINNWKKKRDSYFAFKVDDKIDDDTVLLLNEHIITGRDDPMPPK